MFSRYRNNSFNYNIKKLKLPLLLALTPFPPLVLLPAVVVGVVITRRRH
jgi:hypothetical protein